MSNSPLGANERVARHPNGHLIIERLPLPSAEDFAKKFASVAKAYPVLAEHASHIDGEFDNALTDLRRMVERLLAAVPRPLPTGDGANLDKCFPGPGQSIPVAVVRVVVNGVEREFARRDSVVREALLRIAGFDPDKTQPTVTIRYPTSVPPGRVAMMGDTIPLVDGMVVNVTDTSGA